MINSTSIIYINATLQQYVVRYPNSKRSTVSDMIVNGIIQAKYCLTFTLTRVTELVSPLVGDSFVYTENIIN